MATKTIHEILSNLILEKRPKNVTLFLRSGVNVSGDTLSVYEPIIEEPEGKTPRIVRLLDSQKKRAVCVEVAEIIGVGCGIDDGDPDGGAPEWLDMPEEKTKN